MTTLARLGVFAACTISFACGGGVSTDETEGTGARGAAASDAGGAAGSAASTSGGSGSTDGGAGGSAGSAGVAGSAGSEIEPEALILFEERFEDGDTNDWLRECATLDALPEAAADDSSFGGHLAEKRDRGCEAGYAGTELQSLTPSRIEWWMRADAKGEAFGSFQILDALKVFAGDDMILVYDGEDTKAFDINGDEWHHYELHDIDWTNHTYSFSVDGYVEGTDFSFREPKDTADAIYIAAAARDIFTTPPVSVSVDEIVLYE